MISKRVLFIAAALLVVASTTSVMGQANVNTDHFVVNNLLITPPAYLNLNTNGGYGIVTVTDPAIIQGYVASGANGGTGPLSWNGPGINSSFAAADPDAIHAVGVVKGSDFIDNLGITDFHGHTIASGDSLMQVVKYGDVNFDGIIDGTDYAFIDYGFQNGLTGWMFGDFTYDGLVDGTDYAYIDYVFQNFNSAGAASSAAAVPEPSTVILLATALCAFVAYLRKR